MGVLHDDQRSFDFDDRLFTHVEIVVGLKPRRSEPFYLSWLPSRETGSGRHSVWISTGMPLGIGLNLSDEHSREPGQLKATPIESINR
ncbi:hypothetical protein C5C18_05005 [Rathayibacter tritici]|uniref:DUF7882 domain-containing protein n=1 Tax=Rathayibacter tritici TaxID=33888 RepID=A0A161J356_9MICO|nr:hypothetical protein [Rathayibacter tritici]AND16975.1 hypothetical protein A6122_1847 [Rathayibacter tritici]PPF30394.1 hypothetical protein C5C06_05500 [Rathayibacter tritici]PPF69321.1 hypothetical protein C5C21_02770 [Rathayibacter tritici]PPG08307.1 hypothetical protein C5C18_05005 [Rathayibacter tritici]PPI14663.1 hypothetical protein C5D07_08325 [Rathayibacter tritici]